MSKTWDGHASSHKAKLISSRDLNLAAHSTLRTHHEAFLDPSCDLYDVPGWGACKPRARCRTVDLRCDCKNLYRLEQYQHLLFPDQCLTQDGKHSRSSYLSKMFVELTQLF